MTPVGILSPFRAVDALVAARNRAYLNAAILDCVKRGETPYASHRMLVDALDDNDPEQRRLGMEAGMAMYCHLPKLVAYVDLGVSGGMREEMAFAEAAGVPVEPRSLPEFAECAQ